MKKQALAIALASVVGTFAAVGQAQANTPEPPGPPLKGQTWDYPDLGSADRLGICLTESLLSIVATNVAHSGCTKAEGIYKTSVQVWDTEGSAAVDGVKLKGTLSELIPGKGQLCQIDQLYPGKLYTTGVLVGKGDLYEGNHSWSANGAIFIDHAPGFILANAWWDEHSIKDFYVPDYKCPANGECEKPTVLDYGFEVITKFGYPREKWWETSYYKRENGSLVPGKVIVVKERIVPKSACYLKLEMTGSNDGGGEAFIYKGKIEVSRSELKMF